MTSTMTAFITAVEESKVLNIEQKRELLNNPELLPQAYRSEIAAILIAFDARAKEREDKVKMQVHEVSKRFIQNLETEKISDDVKKSLLEKFQKHVASIR